MQTELKLERTTTNRIGEERMAGYVRTIASAADKRVNAKGVKGEAIDYKMEETVSKDGKSRTYKYSFCVVLSRAVTRSEAVAAKALENAKKHVSRAASAHDFKLLGEAQDVAAKEALKEERQFKVPVRLSSALREEYFAGIYERDAHIRLIYESLLAAQQTNFVERGHVLLYGQAASAKTILFKRFLRLVRESCGFDNAIEEVNATTMTKAGIETWLLDQSQMGTAPFILVFDELEKLDGEIIKGLLSVMDDTATISRTNARTGKVQEECRPLIWATCNDVDRLRSFHSGAIYSRFNAYFCKRPSWELLHEILKDRINQRIERGLPGKMVWADCALKYAKRNNINDARKVISFLAGGDRLITGAYFEDIEAIRKAEEEEFRGIQLSKHA